MTIILAADTVILLLMALLVAGLLRSHAELLRRANEHDEQLTGKRLDGEVMTLEFHGGQPDVVLAFLSTGCATCQEFWAAFRDEGISMPGAAQLVIVTKDGEVESESLLRELAPTSVPLVMSTEAWTSYEVPVSPYFVYIDAESGEIRGEGAASTWPHVQRLLEDAIADLALTPRTGKTGSGNLGRGRLTDSHPDRIREIDATLAAAGITPDHPSLWPEGRPPPPDRSPAD